MKKKCLFCYDIIDNSVQEYHQNCSKKIFANSIPPLLPYRIDQMLELAEKVIKSRESVTGVQPKLSLNIDQLSQKDIIQRFTIVGLWGAYILKPPTKHYPHLPELEDLTMHLAGIAQIKTVPHSLIRLESGDLSYITKRIDRVKGEKIHMEDMCQLTERLTEHKYKGSYEQIGKAIIKYSKNPLLDVINFFEQVIFSFLTGNADMHLKNFSLIDNPHLGYGLAPAYDMVASVLVVDEDDEELALNLNGKKKKLKRKDFLDAMQRFSIDEKTIENIFKKFQNTIDKWNSFIDISFLPKEMKKNYKELIKNRFEQIEI